MTDSPDPDEAEIDRIRSQHRAEIADVAARRKAAWDAYDHVQTEFLATFRKVQRGGLIKSKELEDQGVKVGGMSRATLYRELAKLASREQS